MTNNFIGSFIQVLELYMAPKVFQDGFAVHEE